MIWLLLLTAAAALASSSSDSPTLLAEDEPTGHRELENVQTVDVETYTVLVGQDAEGTWDWRAWLTTVFESGEQLDGLEEGQGFDAPTLEDAVEEARAWVLAQLGDGMVSETAPALTRRGVRVSGDCSTISVSDIGAWISHAAPIVLEYDVDEPDADTLMRMALGRLFPECGITEGASPSIRGQSWELTRDRVQSVIAKILAGELLSVEPVEDVVAARLVGMSAPATDGEAFWHVGQNNGVKHAVVVIPDDVAGWRWFVWQGPRRKWAEAIRSDAAPTKIQAKADARDWADAYHNIGVSTS